MPRGWLLGTRATARLQISQMSFPPGALSIQIGNAGTLTGTAGAAIDTYDGLVLTNAGHDRRRGRRLPGHLAAA